MSPFGGGGGGIRTHGPLARTTVFKTVTIGRSDTPPRLRSTTRRSLSDSQVQTTSGLEIRSLVDGLFLDCKVTGKAKATIAYYNEKLAKFLWYVDKFNLPKKPEEYTANHIRSFLAYARSTEVLRWGSHVLGANRV